VRKKPILAVLFLGALAAGLSYQATADVAVRGLVLRDSARRDTRVVLQVYFYKSL